MTLFLVIKICSVSLYRATISKILIPDETRLSTSEVPTDSFLESLCKMRIRGSDQLRTVFAMYEQALNQDRS